MSSGRKMLKGREVGRRRGRVESVSLVEQIDREEGRR